MCKRKGEGLRCAVTPQSQQYELYRQKVKYQARKSGTTPKEWLLSEQGKNFEQANNPRVLNPNWKQEHKENLAKIKHEKHPQVTLNDTYLATSQEKEMIKSNFLTDDSIRGTSELAKLPLGDYLEEITDRNPEISHDEHSALSFYSSSHYRKVNAVLNYSYQEISKDEYIENIYGYGGSSSIEMDELVREKITHIDKALMNRRETAEVTYRGIVPKGTLKESTEKYQLNTVIKFDSYSSTSHSPQICMYFSEHGPDYGSEKDDEYDYKVYGVTEEDDNHSIMFEVHTNAGRAIADSSNISREREVLLPRGMHFKVVGTRQATSDSPYKFKDQDHKTVSIKDRFLVVQLAECDEQGNLISPNTQEPYKTPELPDILNRKDNNV